MSLMRKELKNTYRGPDKAYGSMDYTGRGFISQDDFLSSMVCTRIPYSREDLIEFFKQNNLFSSENEGITFDMFKKTFFP